MVKSDKSASCILNRNTVNLVRRGGLLMLLAMACAALAPSVSFSQTAPAIVDASKPRFAYPVKFVCGSSSEAFQEGVVLGTYATAINILNPRTQSVTFEKRIARGLPLQRSGANVALAPDRLGPGQAIEVECNEVRGHLPLPMTAQFRTGFLIVVSNTELVVTAVYSGRPRSDHVTASDIVSIKPTLIAPVRPPSGATGLCRLLERSSALIEGKISDISGTYDPVVGPRENITFSNVQTHFGEPVGTQFVVRNLRGLVLDEPEKTYLESPKIPRFVRGGHYLIYLTRTHWFYSPVVFDGAYRVETVANQEVLIDQQGHALNPKPTENAFAAGEKLNPNSAFSTRPLALKQLFETRIDLDDPNAPQPMLPGIGQSTVENAFDRSGYIDFVKSHQNECIEPFSGEPTPLPREGRVWSTIGTDQLADPNLQLNSSVPCGSPDPQTGATRVCK